MISFAYTTPALLAGVKRVTRRQWQPTHAAKFRERMAVDAYDKSQRCGGKKVGTIELTAPIVLEPIAAMPDTDYDAEGFGYLYQHTADPRFSPDTFEAWKLEEITYYVVRFRLLDTTPYGDEVLEQWLATPRTYPPLPRSNGAAPTP
jgi:hypothetical protein